MRHLKRWSRTVMFLMCITVPVVYPEVAAPSVPFSSAVDYVLAQDEPFQELTALRGDWVKDSVWLGAKVYSPRSQRDADETRRAVPDPGVSSVHATPMSVPYVTMQ